MVSICISNRKESALVLPRYVGDEKWLDITIGGCLALGKRSVVFAKRLIFRYVGVQKDQVFQVWYTIGQSANGKVFTCERLQHKNFTLIYWMRQKKLEKKFKKKTSKETLPPTHAIVTPPSSESEKRSMKVPRRHCFNKSSVCFRPMKPTIVLQSYERNTKYFSEGGKQCLSYLSIHGARRCSRVSFIRA